MIWYLAEQLRVYPKACHKLPVFTQNHCWYTEKSYEQSSSEATALYKSSLFSGKNFLDLSGGLGVDDWAFSKNFQNVVSLDPNLELNEMVRINWEKLKLINCERIDSTAKEYLAGCNINFDLVYIDADRRTEAKRSFLISDADPDYLGLTALLFPISKKILLKLSPYIDLQYLKEHLSFLTHIYVVSVNREVKEVLALVQPDVLTNVKITAVEIGINGQVQIFSAEQDNEIKNEGLFEPLWFFEPAPSIIKAGLSIAYSNGLQLFQLSKNTSFYVGMIAIPYFMGRSFLIISHFEFSKASLVKYLQKNMITKANITRRHFNMSVEEIRQVFKIKEGGKEYLFFATLCNNKRMVYHCHK
ncbi:MAG: hypothetical protein H7296_11330 [Bacteroidia bacterium]|nr:hypothetical protein [Bacteroidia bacterium]